jgi:hypothetical protein
MVRHAWLVCLLSGPEHDDSVKVFGLQIPCHARIVWTDLLVKFRCLPQCFLCLLFLLARFENLSPFEIRTRFLGAKAEVVTVVEDLYCFVK